MKLLIPIILYMILASGMVSAEEDWYSWSGKLNLGQSVYLDGNRVLIDFDNATNTAAAVLHLNGDTYIVRQGQTEKVGRYTIQVQRFNDYVILSISAAEPFSVSFNATEDYSEQVKILKEENARLKSENEKLSKQVQSLTEENKKLKAQVDSLKKENAQLKGEMKGQPNTAALDARLVNLTRENRELKAELANITTKYNALKAKADFLSQQNDEYRTMIQNLLKETAQGSTEDYIQKAKKERLIGSVLLKSILLAGVVVGLVGYGLYKKKRSWELGGL